MESLSSFDLSEEDNHLILEDILWEPAPGQLTHEFEINEEKPSKAEAADVNNCDLERSSEALPIDTFFSLLPPPSSPPPPPPLLLPLLPPG